MRTARLVDNRTLMATAAVPMELPDGREVITIIAKATWDIGDDGTAALPLVPAPVRRTAVPRSPGEASSERYPYDVAPLKPGTDVLLVGTAEPPPGGRAKEMSVRLRVGRGDELVIDKEARVFGPRVWRMGMLEVAPSAPQELTPTPLSWENTYGGTVYDDGRLYEPRNPVGNGLARDRTELVGRPVPPIESPSAPLGSKQPAPMGFGPVGTSWEPRAARFGTPDERWRRERAPLMPYDFDPRWFCCAPDDQWVPVPLEGPVNVEVQGVRPRAWRFRLPPGRPIFASTHEGEREERRPSLDTVLIDADEGRVELTWRSSFFLPRKSERFEPVVVRYQEPLPSPFLEDLARRYREVRPNREASQVEP